MRINIRNIPDEGLDLRFAKGSDWLRLVFQEGDRGYFRTDVVDVHCLVRRLGENVFLEGRVITKLFLDCSRCLELVTLPVDSVFRYTLTPVPEDYAEEVELSGEDLEHAYYDGETIDLDPLVYEQVIIQIPMKVLCRGDCLGLCPVCGSNRNMESCPCQDDQVDERLAILKNFRTKK